MIFLPPDLLNLYKALDKHWRAHVDAMAARTPDRVEGFLRDRLARIEAERRAVERAMPIPGLTPPQSAFLRSLDDDRRAVFDGLDPLEQQGFLQPFEQSLDPILAEESRRRLTPLQPRKPRPLSTVDAPAGAIDLPARRKRIRPTARLSPRRRSRP